MTAERLTYTAQEAAAALGIGRTKMASLLRHGEVPSFTWAGRRLIRADDLRAVLDRASGRSPERNDVPA